MDDFSALAQRVAVSVGDVRGCLILSRDGLVLGSYPDEDESVAKPAWLRFAALGEAQKSFVEFPDQVWVYANRGPYMCFAVAGTSIRPGVLLDTMEQALLLAEEARTKKDALRVPDAAAAPSGKPRASVHPPSERAAEEATAGPAAERARPGDGPGAEAEAEPEPKPAEPVPSKASGGSGEEEGEVDRVLLAQEFSGLFKQPAEGDEASS
jgi:hypothetical protein